MDSLSKLVVQTQMELDFSDAEEESGTSLEISESESAYFSIRSRSGSSTPIPAPITQPDQSFESSSVHSQFTFQTPTPTQIDVTSSPLPLVLYHHPQRGPTSPHTTPMPFVTGTSERSSKRPRPDDEDLSDSEPPATKMLTKNLAKRNSIQTFNMHRMVQSSLRTKVKKATEINQQLLNSNVSFIQTINVKATEYDQLRNNAVQKLSEAEENKNIEIENMRNEVEKTKKDVSASIKEFEDLLVDKDSALDRLDSQIEESNRCNDVLQESIKELEAQLVAQDEELQRLQAGASLNESDGSTEDVRMELETLKRSLATKNQEMDAMYRLHQQNEINWDIIKTGLNKSHDLTRQSLARRQHASIAKFQEKLKMRAIDNDKLNARIQELHAEIAALKKEREDEIRSVDFEKDPDNARLEEMEASITTHESTISSQDAEIVELKRVLKEARDQAAQLTQQDTGLRKREKAYLQGKEPDRQSSQVKQDEINGLQSSLDQMEKNLKLFYSENQTEQSKLQGMLNIEKNARAQAETESRNLNETVSKLEHDLEISLDAYEKLQEHALVKETEIRRLLKSQELLKNEQKELERLLEVAGREKEDAIAAAVQNERRRMLKPSTSRSPHANLNNRSNAVQADSANTTEASNSAPIAEPSIPAVDDDVNMNDDYARETTGSEMPRSKPDSELKEKVQSRHRASLAKLKDWRKEQTSKKSGRVGVQFAGTSCSTSPHQKHWVRSSGLEQEGGEYEPQPLGNESGSESEPSPSQQRSNKEDVASRLENYTKKMLKEFQSGMEELVGDTVRAFQESRSPSVGQKRSAKSRPRSRRAEGKMSAADEKSRESKEERASFTGTVRGLFHSLFGVTKYDDFACAASADKIQVRGYEASENNGPDVDDILIDFRGKLNSKWNERVIDIMTDYVVDNINSLEPLSELPQRSNSYYEDIVRDYVQRAMSCWRDAQPKLLESGDMETPVQIEARLLNKGDRVGQRARSTTRRISIFKRRAETVDLVIRKMERNKEPGLWLWKWLKDLLNYLNDAGMSSDESACDIHGNPFFAVKTLPWRAQIDGPLKMIDDRYLGLKSEQNKRGAKPTPRKRQTKSNHSNRLPPRDMPKAMYDQQWLEDCPDIRNLHLSKDKFQILDIK